MAEEVPSTHEYPVLYIKLGEGSSWAEECLTQGKVIIGFTDLPRQVLEPFDYDAIRSAYSTLGYAQGAATLYANQLWYFWNATPKTIWLAFHKERLWWCRTENEVEFGSDDRKIRRTIGAWHDSDTSGNPLWLDDISGQLLKVQGYRSTICIPEAADYAIRRINGVAIPEVALYNDSLEQLRANVEVLVQHLTWADFEVLVDLIFRAGGFQRLATVGRQRKAVDISLIHPLLKEQVFVQVKAEASLSTYLAWKQECATKPTLRNYFACHTPAADLGAYSENDPRFRLLKGRELAQAIIEHGLMEWVAKKVA